MDDLADLYQEIILDHSRRPRGQGRIAAPDAHAEGYNPLCGDRISLDLDLADGRVAQAVFQGQGCAISQASASLLTETVQGRTVEEARALAAQMFALVAGDLAAAEAVDFDEQAEALAAFAGVRDYPSRVKCATLAWHALKQALDEAAAAGV
ncbi:MAG TPA: SUF system NifU family Fe-S cluster assembly protein [Anaerolineae bacterium]|nr:SUF system NifU family Fe-S cluster assembly protein [Ardenticatenia bacterium]MBK8539309.1 SUF system NifU family Fe-S cluster assembly protein [Ardenticatenia bacterium]HQZ71270.1 SUF system NifU family Fe-S cluster assembly protein [Anaerolineae bacterium]